MTVADFKNIRDNVDIQQVAEWLGLEAKKGLFSSQIRCPCPINDGGPRALVITPKINRYYCFATACREGGDAIALVSKVRKIPARDAALALQAQFLNHTYRQDFSPQEKLQKVEDRLVYENEHVQALGLSPNQAHQLGIGWSKGGTMPSRLLVAIRNRDGLVCGYLGLTAGDIKVPKTWYNV